VAERTVVFRSRRLRSAGLVGTQDGAGERSDIVLRKLVPPVMSRAVNRNEHGLALVAHAETRGRSGRGWRTGRIYARSSRRSRCPHLRLDPSSPTPSSRAASRRLSRMRLRALRANCACITIQIMLELTWCRYHIVLFRAQNSCTTHPTHCPRPSSHILLLCIRSRALLRRGPPSALRELRARLYLHRSHITDARGVVLREGHLSKLEASCTCITAPIMLELTRYRYHAVLFARTVQSYHAPKALPTPFLPHPPPLPPTPRHSSTPASMRPYARRSLYRSLIYGRPWSCSSCHGSRSRRTDLRGRLGRLQKRAPGEPV
jgi:hypothetical protein